MIELEDRGFEVKVIKDSLSDLGCRLTTLQLRYPRFIHSQFMTHRVFSRNARSSRATPIEVNCDLVRNDLAAPVFWGSNKRGMQPGVEVKDVESAENRWLHASYEAIGYAEDLSRLKVHKQIANRLLEPYMWIDVVVTSTKWSNWDGLRIHGDAQSEIQLLAQMMKEARKLSEPTNRKWHLPYVDCDDPGEDKVPIKCSVARCARVSFKPFDSSTENIQKDVNLYKQLLEGSDFGHWSPFEHVAFQHNETYDYPCEDGSGKMLWRQPIRSGNFDGWVQWRKTFKGESL